MIFDIKEENIFNLRIKNRFQKNFLKDVQICSKKKHKAPGSNHSHLIILTMAWHVVNDFIILALFGVALDMRRGGVKWD